MLKIIKEMSEKTDLRNPTKCPSFGSSNFAPTGKRIQNDSPKEPFRKEQEQTEYLCNDCGIKHHTIGLNEYLGAS